MGDYKYIILNEMPSLKERAAEWFHSKWGVPTEAYLECMEGFLNGETEYGWYLCLDGGYYTTRWGDERYYKGMQIGQDFIPHKCAVFITRADFTT